MALLIKKSQEPTIPKVLRVPTFEQKHSTRRNGLVDNQDMRKILLTYRQYFFVLKLKHPKNLVLKARCEDNALRSKDLKTFHIIHNYIN